MHQMEKIDVLIGKCEKLALSIWNIEDIFPSVNRPQTVLYRSTNYNNELFKSHYSNKFHYFTAVCAIIDFFSYGLSNIF